MEHADGGDRNQQQDLWTHIFPPISKPGWICASSLAVVGYGHAIRHERLFRLGPDRMRGAASEDERVSRLDLHTGPALFNDPAAAQNVDELQGLVCMLARVVVRVPMIVPVVMRTGRRRTGLVGDHSGRRAQ